VALVLPTAVLLPVSLWVQYTADFGLAYQGGVEAWSSGHPQRLLTWTATPLLALVMAAVSRVASLDVAARVFMVIDVLVWGALLYVIWVGLRDRASTSFWWATFAAAVVFAPAIETIFWLQPNLIVFALALLGFALAGRRDRTAGVLIGLSIALKPITVLVPLGMLFRRETRTAGIWAIATAAALSFAGLAFLAWRAGDARVLNPFDYLAGFLSKGQGPIAACVPENYSPVALLCRLGVPPSTAVTVAVAAAALTVGWLLIRYLPKSTEARGAIFAAACLLSGMLGPIDWASYGVLTAPLFFLLAYQFWRDGAPPALWIGLGLAYLLAELVWDPLESLAQAPVAVVVVSYSAGQFSQYVLLLVWVRWQMLRATADRRVALHTVRP
jgi:arabinofuranan 3-O-arabinosyltransferase